MRLNSIQISANSLRKCCECGDALHRNSRLIDECCAAAFDEADHFELTDGGFIALDGLQATLVVDALLSLVKIEEVADALEHVVLRNVDAGADDRISIPQWVCTNDRRVSELFLSWIGILSGAVVVESR